MYQECVNIYYSRHVAYLMCVYIHNLKGKERKKSKSQIQEIQLYYKKHFICNDSIVSFQMI